MSPGKASLRRQDLSTGRGSGYRRKAQRVLRSEGAPLSVTVQSLDRQTEGPREQPAGCTEAQCTTCNEHRGNQGQAGSLGRVSPQL